MSSQTKRGYKYNRGGIPIKGRKSHKGYRDMFEDRKRSREKTLALKYKLAEKRDNHYFNPEKYQPLTELEEKIYQSLQNIQGRDRWEKSTDDFRRLCIGPTGSHERGKKMQYLMGGKEISHPDDSTFKKRVKVLNDMGRRVLRSKRRNVQAIAQEV